MVIQIAITGGKGGTGKSFVATNLAILLSIDRDVVLADLDLEAPNDHIILGIESLENEEPIKIFMPFIDITKCRLCKICSRVCTSGAILVPTKGYPIVFPRLCSGCSVCLYACPYNAIKSGARVVGYSYVTKVPKYSSRLTLVTGILREGEEHVPPAVVVVKKRALDIVKDILLIDTGAG
ncbi:MAG TPA: cobalamin biosynthesis protein CobQ, partial [Ignisphaera sp.]|nr:cobalamin biosynthesis protein CobQ [Ignisphaera sp.]